MFWHLFKYRIKSLLGAKVIVFWSFIYPILLGTLFYVSFGSGIGRDRDYKPVPVAVVKEDGCDTEFAEVLEDITYSGDVLMFDVTYTDLDSAEELLGDDKIAGIAVLSGDTHKLIMGRTSLSASILKEFTDVYDRNVELYKTAAETDYTKIERVESILTDSKSIVESVSFGGEKLDNFIQYFYGLLAMACLFASFVGVQLGSDVQATGSLVGARKCVSAANWFTMIVSDLLAAVAINFAGLVLVYIYLRYILGMPLGDKTGLAIVVLFLGSLVGIESGQFVSCVARGKDGLKIGLSLSFSMISSALSGLMSSDLKSFVDVHAPMLSRINPGTVIADCFYCLNLYNDYRRFSGCLIILAVEALIMIVCSFLAVRRCKYVSA